MKRRRALQFTFSVVLAQCAACGVWLHRERQQYAINRQLIAALMRDDTKTALALVNEGADPNTRYDPPPSPTFAFFSDQLLHHAPPVNDSPTAFMLACGADWNFPRDLPGNPGTVEENLPLLQAMLTHGANVCAKTFFDETALHITVFMGRVQTAELLLQHGTNVNGRDKEGNTPLMMVEGKRTANVTRLLLSQGANPNRQNNQGWTALHHAVLLPTATSALPELLAHGADPTVHDDEGLTPLEEAQKEGNTDAVRLLTQRAK